MLGNTQWTSEGCRNTEPTKKFFLLPPILRHLEHVRRRPHGNASINLSQEMDRHILELKNSDIGQTDEALERFRVVVWFQDRVRCHMRGRHIARW